MSIHGKMGEGLLDAEFLSKLELLSIISRKIFRGEIKGERRSRARGTSSEFADYRSYSVGDDFRYLDWNLYARLEKLFLKLFLEEEDLRINLLIDCSKSMSFGEPPKLNYAKKVAAAFGYIGLCNLDRVGATSFSSNLTGTFPAVRGKANVFNLLRFLDGISCGGETRMERCLQYFCAQCKKPGVAIILSDCLTQDDKQEALKYLIYHKFDTYIIHILEETELSPQLAGDLRLIDSETGEVKEITVSEKLLRNYQRFLKEYCGKLQDFCLKNGISYIRASTSVPFEELVLTHLRKSRFIK